MTSIDGWCVELSTVLLFVPQSCGTVHFTLAGTSDYSTTSGPISTPSPSTSPTPSGVPVAPNSYVLPAAISAAAVLLVVVLVIMTAIFVVVITRRPKTQKSLDVQRLSSIYYQSTQSDVALEDNQLHTGQSADIPIHDEKASVDTNTNIEIRDAPRSYAAGVPLNPMTTLSKVLLQRSRWQKELLAGLHLRHQFAQMRSPPIQHLEWSPGCILAC